MVNYNSGKKQNKNKPLNCTVPLEVIPQQSLVVAEKQKCMLVMEHIL